MSKGPGDAKMGHKKGRGRGGIFTDEKKPAGRKVRAGKPKISILIKKSGLVGFDPDA